MDPKNPFDLQTDPDRHAIWHMMIIEDSHAFVTVDWQRIANDFDAENFEGLRAMGSNNPDDWRIVFPDLKSYRDNWTKSAHEYLQKQFVGMTHLQAVFARTHLDEIEITADRALAHKKFHGTLQLSDGSQLSGSRQTIYRLHKQKNHWKIAGFIGQLPL